MQRARTRLVTAREEERRRLRRDLHDGLGPQLASQTLALDAAGGLIRADPAAADEMLVQLRDQTGDAVAGIRRLVYDLRPPVLDDRGLLAALAEQAARFEHDGLRVTLDLPDVLPALPAALDVALYRIALEAVTNVVRHARASSCDIALRTEPGWIVLLVRDDGRGLPPDHVSGVGCASMRERAAELGDSVTVESRSAYGTGVTARLPLVQEI